MREGSTTYEQLHSKVKFAATNGSVTPTIGAGRCALGGATALGLASSTASCMLAGRCPTLRRHNCVFIRQGLEQTFILTLVTFPVLTQSQVTSRLSGIRTFCLQSRRSAHGDVCAAIKSDHSLQIVQDARRSSERRITRLEPLAFPSKDKTKFAEGDAGM